jgi:dienelactone hydrolase
LLNVAEIVFSRTARSVIRDRPGIPGAVRHNSPVRIGRILAATVMLLAVVAGFLTYVRVQSQRPVSIAPAGPYPVGRITDLWVDRSRTDQFAPIGGTPRMLSTWIWYPAGGPGPESAYAPGEWSAMQRYGWASTSLDRVRTGTRDEPSWAKGRFPIVVLLPDLGLAAPQYAAVASGLAARGTVVVGVTPTYSSRLSVIDGHRVPATAAGSATGREAQLVSVWAADARFAAARATQQFGSNVNGAELSYVGHGLGGTAAIEACHLDGHCTAAASLDGTPVSPDGAPASDGFSRPLLLLNTPGPASPPAARAFTLRGAERLSFTDLAAFHVSAPLRRALPLGTINGRHALTITTEFVSSFLRSATHGSPWTPPTYPEVQEATVLSR